MPAARHQGGHRLNRATTALRQSLAGIRLSLGQDHPVPGCLPLPHLRIPGAVEELAEYQAELERNLWDGQSLTPAWRHAKNNCPHLSGTAVHTVWETIGAWRGLVTTALAYTRGTATAQQLADRQHHIVARLDDLHHLTVRTQL